jgi:hypothetical protein
MESISNPIEQANLACPACAAQATTDDAFCNGCGYPLQGTEKEQQMFLSVRDAKSFDLDEAHKKIKRSSNALFFIGGLTVIAGLAAYAVSKDHSTKINVLLTNVILGAIYVVLGFWCKKKPLAAIISGLSLYVLIFVLNAVVNPLTIVSGIIFKIVIVGMFINGIKSAIEAEKIKKELNI